MQRDSDEDAWRAIVENYGDRVELDEEPAAGPGPATPAGPSAAPTAQPAEEPPADAAAQARLERLFQPLPQPEERRDLTDEEIDAFVPPTPPPLPTLPPDRFLAWAGLFGSPTVLLVCLVLGVHLAPWLGYLLVASFIGGFVYLVVQMPRGSDIDPWDDGARL